MRMPCCARSSLAICAIPNCGRLRRSAGRVSWDRMPFDQRELAFHAKEAALRCLVTFLTSPAYRAALRYAVHDHLVTAAFAGLLLLKVAKLFPGKVEVLALLGQVRALISVRATSDGRLARLASTR